MGVNEGGVTQLSSLQVMPGTTQRTFFGSSWAPTPRAPLFRNKAWHRSMAMGCSGAAAGAMPNPKELLTLSVPLS